MGQRRFRAPLIKENRVNARYRRKISRMIRQMLNQGEKKGGRQELEWGEFEKGRESRQQFESKQLGEQQMHYVEPLW